MKKIKGKGIMAKIINSMLGWIYKPSFCRKKKAYNNKWNVIVNCGGFSKYRLESLCNW